MRLMWHPITNRFSRSPFAGLDLGPATIAFTTE
jgi:hypothetical protein